jgi:hypothetical protein
MQAIQPYVREITRISAVRFVTRLTFPAKSEDGSSSLQKQLITIIR